MYLASTQDLIGKFLLTDQYDKYVRPYTTPDGESGSGLDVKPILPPVTPGGFLDKGKAKETVASSPVHQAPPRTPAADNQDRDEDGDKKTKNSYKHLIKGVPGMSISPLLSSPCGHQNVGRE